MSSDGLKMKYFVLNPTKDSHYGAASRAAIMEYAKCIQPKNPKLALDLVAWLKVIDESLNVENE